VGLNPARVRP